jgi:hypothetical protein
VNFDSIFSLLLSLTHTHTLTLSHDAVSDVKLTAEDEQTIEAELARLQKSHAVPTRDTHADRWVLVEGAPKVGADKKEKLEKVLLKHAALAGTVVSVASPADEAGMTTG